MPAPRPYKVLWSAAAASDLETILEFIAAEHPDNAFRALKSLRTKASKLQSLPNRGRIVPELRKHGITMYREVIHTPWRIIYRITGKQVHVLAVVDSRRNIEDTLLDRLIRDT